jgi:hypothetical protein
LGGGDYGGDVAVHWGTGAELWVSAIAEIRPAKEHPLALFGLGALGKPYQRPCRVQESSSPIAGLVSQN